METNTEESGSCLETCRAGLLDQLYATVMDAGAWEGFLRQLVAATDSRSARLLVLDRQAQSVQYSTKVNIDDNEHRAYVDHYVNVCPWRPELQNKEPGQFYSTRLDFSCDQEAFYRTEFYNDWARHLDIHHGMLGTVFRDPRYTVQLLVQRTEGQGFFPRTHTEAMNRLLPHIQQALRLSRSLNEERERNGAALAAAEQSSLPYMLFDKRGTLVHVSGRCRQVLSRFSDVQIRDEQLHFEQAEVARHFRRMLESLTRAPVHSHQTNSDCVEIPRREGPPVRLFASLLEPGVREASLWPCPAHVVVYVQEPLAGMDIDRHKLGRHYGLSLAEAGVALQVACGHTPAEIAAQNGCSPHTIRTQLKAAFRKTGTRRQSELATLVLQSPAVRGQSPHGAPVSLVHRLP